MQNRSVEELIEDLQQLRIQETIIIAQLREANRARNAVRAEGEEDHNVNEGAAVFALTRGDRVRIKNRVRRPATTGPTWTEENEPLATITKVTADQIHIVTDNGTKTWQAPNNLRLI